MTTEDRRELHAALHAAARRNATRSRDAESPDEAYTYANAASELVNAMRELRVV